VNNAGYPADRGGVWQFRAYNRVADLTADRILYVNDTAGGQSGGPVWLRWEQHRVVVGVHTNGFNPRDPSARQVNSGVRLNATNLAAIRAWTRA
jgi:V8-like Glu-specific endopeptidase